METKDCVSGVKHTGVTAPVLSERHIEHIALRHTGIEHFADRAFHLYIFEYEKQFFLLKRVYQCCGCIGTNFLHHLQ